MAEPPIRQYDPAKVHLVVGFKLISDFAAGTFIRLRPLRADHTITRGIDGELVRQQLNGRSRSLEFTLAAGAADNDYLSILRAADVGSVSVPGGITYIVALKDGNGRTLMAADTAWFESAPDDVYGLEGEPRTWRMIIHDGIGHYGGMPDVGDD